MGERYLRLFCRNAAGATFLTHPAKGTNRGILKMTHPAKGTNRGILKMTHPAKGTNRGILKMIRPERVAQFARKTRPPKVALVCR